MSKMSVTVHGNLLIVDGESYVCESGEQAMSLCDEMSRGGWHIEDRSEAMEVAQTMEDASAMAKKRYRDHYAASPQEEAECLNALQDILSAETDMDRAEVVDYYAKGSYPELATMAYRAIESLRKAGDKQRTAEVVHGLAEHLPEVFNVMQRVYAA